MSQYYTVVEYRGSRAGYSCGYCRSESTKHSSGMWAHSLTTEDYQSLLDRGWRRSGKYVYKPTMDKTCCPQYVIRCPVDQFRPTKSHKKVMKRNNKYLNTGVKPSGRELVEDGGDAEMDNTEANLRERTVKCKPAQTDSNKHGTAEHNQDPMSSAKKSMNKTDKGAHCDREVSQTTGQAVQQSPNCSKQPPKPGVGPDPTKPQCVKAKTKRLEKKQAKQGQASNASNIQKNNTPKPLTDFLEGIKSDAVHKLEVRLVRSSPRSEQFEQTFQESYSVYKNYQIQIHGDPPDKPSQKQYTRFLVDSPLEPVHKVGGKSPGYGSFHQQYVLDGRIIAVGVLDILPNCVSSVYLYYDPDYRFLSLGTYSALREVDFTRSLQVLEPSIQYYYMGFYIHSCPKMKYKGQFSPSYLLCPETYTWCPLEKCEPQLDASRYSRFDETSKTDEDGATGDIREILCLHMQQIMPYFVYQALTRGRDSEEVQQYAKLVGLTCAKRMLLYRVAPSSGNDDDDDDD